MYASFAPAAWAPACTGHRCPVRWVGGNMSSQFERVSREVLGIHLNERFEEQFVKGALVLYPYPHSLTLDLVNADASVIGDAKYFSMNANGYIVGKLKNATDYAEALMNAPARTRFLVFGEGQDGGGIQVAQIWTRRVRNRRFPQINAYFLSAILRTVFVKERVATRVVIHYG
jgi:hypothetical protein